MLLDLFKPRKKEPTIFDYVPTFKTTTPDTRLPFNEWARQYRVSSLYERTKIVYVERLVNLL